MDEGDDPSINGRCDVNILLLVNPKVNKITTISIPRDSYVPNPALGYASDKLTHLGNNGPENSIAASKNSLVSTSTSCQGQLSPSSNRRYRRRRCRCAARFLRAG
ncbi:MAG: LCP family protein [Merdibacter sp.]